MNEGFSTSVRAVNVQNTSKVELADCELAHPLASLVVERLVVRCGHRPPLQDFCLFSKVFCRTPLARGRHRRMSAMSPLGRDLAEILTYPRHAVIYKSLDYKTIVGVLCMMNSTEYGPQICKREREENRGGGGTGRPLSHLSPRAQGTSTCVLFLF